jgi:hypothetical protein
MSGLVINQPTNQSINQSINQDQTIAKHPTAPPSEPKQNKNKEVRRSKE